MHGMVHFWHVRLTYCVQPGGLRLKFMVIVQHSYGIVPRGLQGRLEVLNNIAVTQFDTAVRCNAGADVKDGWLPEACCQCLMLFCVCIRPACDRQNNQHAIRCRC